ncbi:MAG: hypothetical protein Q8L46_00725 [candidate division WWE3 bacterium]|nr:hypothetical protein [candidate division WWE3 bacterium]
MPVNVFIARKDTPVKAMFAEGSLAPAGVPPEAEGVALQVITSFFAGIAPG